MITSSGKTKLLLLLPVMLPSLLVAAGNTAYINEIPDFTQSRITGWQYGHGSEYCAPVAVSNSLMWMTDLSSEQADLAKLLASGRYMNTDIWKGTTTTKLLRGVDAIARDLLGGYVSLEYQGWKKHPVQFSTGTKVPDIHWITDGISKDSAVWLNVGWYQYDRVNDIYHRVGGHWVTLVGYDDSILIIHDPAPRAGQSFANEHVYTARIGSGILTGRLSGLPRPARGYLLLGKGMHLKSIADVAIVDGAVRFRR
jgi:hypothetical protein